MSDALYELYARILELPRPVLAALDGPAIGGGLQLAISCDLRVAAPGAWLAARGPGHGLAVAAWGLPTLVGRSRALDLCLTGRRIDAEEALAIGLVDRVDEDPGATAVALAAEFAELDEPAVARVKKIVAHGPRHRARRGGGRQPGLGGRPAAPMNVNGGWEGAVRGTVGRGCDVG